VAGGCSPSLLAKTLAEANSYSALDGSRRLIETRRCTKKRLTRQALLISSPVRLWRSLEYVFTFHHQHSDRAPLHHHHNQFSTRAQRGSGFHKLEQLVLTAFEYQTGLLERQGLDITWPAYLMVPISRQLLLPLSWQLRGTHQCSL